VAGEPSDFGQSPVQTLARVGDPTPAREHSGFWSHWLGLVDGDAPRLIARISGGQGEAEIDPSDPTCTHGFASLGGVRIGARLCLPPPGQEIRAGLVSTHGYAVSKPIEERDSLFASLVDRGVAVLNIRVRGFAGSRLDCGDLQTPGSEGLGWITRGLDDPDASAEGTMAWVYPQAVADVFQACRALRAWLAGHTGEEKPLYLHGESFGGGLAVPAAAKLEGRGIDRARIDRLVLALPTMGDWPWRLGHPLTRGAGAQILALLERRADLGDLIRGRLRLMDSVVHASRVRCPVLCKLAERDEVVPAPTAAAVFNGLRVDPGLKWRFVVPHGHAETGIANARRHAEFERCAADFLDPGRSPNEAMLAWNDRLSGRGAPAAGAGGETPLLFGAPGQSREQAHEEDPDQLDAVVRRAYERTGRTLDDLPYTEDFEQLWSSVAKATNAGRRELFHRLHNMRKAGKLPRLGRAHAQPPSIEPAEESMLATLVIEAVGTLGQRDRLPYTPAFDALLERFSAQTGRRLSAHDCWRLVAKLSK